MKRTKFLCYAVLLLLCVTLFAGCDADTENTCAAGHQYGVEHDREEPTCTEDGLLTQVCQVCGEVKEKVLAATGHEPGEWIIVTEPTGLDTGLRRKTCNHCAEVLETEIIPALGEAACETAHTPCEWRLTPGIAACAESINRLHCAVCDAVLETKTVPSTIKHTMGGWRELTAATCEKEGEEARSCTGCGTILGRRPLEKKEHTKGEWVTDTPATCTEPGLASLPCLVCENTVETKPLKALGHQKKPFEASDVTEGLCVRYCARCAELMETGYPADRAYHSEDLVSVILSDYSLVYYDTVVSGKSSALLTGAVEQLATTLTARTGHTFAPVTGAGAAQYEILVGATDREESQKALADIEGYGFIIRVTGSKIVIVGSTDLLTIEAMAHFAKWYTQGETVPVEARSFDRTAVKLNELAGIVYDRNTDTDTSNEYGVVSSSSVCGGGVDYVYTAAGNIQKEIRSLTNIKLALGTDDTQRATEVLVGRMDREQIPHCLALLEGEEYGIFAIDGKVVLISWSDAGMQAVVPVFLSLLYEAIAFDKNGDMILLFTEGFEHIGVTNESWITDFPRPSGEGVSLYNTADAADGAFQLLYRGATEETYRAYYQELIAAGYTVVTRREVEGSVFATFVDRARGTTLYVAYNAFSHADESSYQESFPCIRIVSAPLNESTLPPEVLLAPSPYTKVTNSAITAVALPSGYIGTGYVILLEDGSFIVLDGGNYSTATVDNMWSILSDLHTKVWGSAPSKEQPIRIAAWINSHSHGDHFKAFYEFAKKYAKKGLVTMDYLLANQPAPSMIYNTGEASMTLHNYKDQLMGYFPNDPVFIKVHTGVTLYFPGLEIETLYTHEDMNPHRIVTFNDTSAVMRLVLTPSEGEEKGRSVSLMWTGDAYIYSGQWMTAMYGEYLATEMVTVAHHGGIGLQLSFYEIVNAKVVWYPNLRGNYALYGPNAGYAYFSHWKSKAYNVTLYLGMTGPFYDELYNAGFGEQLTYDGSVCIKVA